jgi:hypothetical protein
VAWTGQNSVAVNSKAAGNTIAGNFAGNVGDTIFLYVACDNVTATTPTVTDITKLIGETNDWVYVGSHDSPQSAAGGGVIAHCYYLRPTRTWSGVSVTVTLSASSTAKVLSGFRITPHAAGGGGVKGFRSWLSGQTMSSIDVLQGDMAVVFHDNESTATATAPAFLLNGVTAQVGNGGTAAATSGGGAASNVAATWLVLNSVAAPSNNNGFNVGGTLTNTVAQSSTDGGAILVLLEGAPAAPTQQGAVTMTASSTLTAAATVTTPPTYQGAVTMTASSVLTSAATVAKGYAGAATMTALSTMTAAATTVGVKAGAVAMTAPSVLTSAAIPPKIANPTAISGLAIWLDADDPATMTLSGSSVQVWRDKSGANNHATADVGMEPTVHFDAINSRDVVKFVAASTQFFRLPDAGFSTAPALEAFVMIRVEVDPPVVAANIGIWCIQTITNNSNYPATTGIIWDGFGSTTRRTTVNPTEDLTQWNVYSAGSAPNNWNNWLNHRLLYHDGVNVVGVNPALGLTLGKSSTTYYTDGEMAEFVIYNRALTPVEHAQVVDYLLTKWNSVAVVEYAAAVVMTATSVTTVAGTLTKVYPGAVSMTAPSTLTTAAVRTQPAAVTMTAPSSTTIAAVRATAGLAAMTAPSTLTVGATRATAAAVTMTAGSTFTAETSLSGTHLGAVSMTASSVLTIAAVRLTPATVAMTAPSSLVAAGVRTAVAAVSMTATSTLTSAVTAVRVVGVQMSTPSTLTAGVLRVTSATVTMTAPSILTAAATILVGGAFSPDVLPGLVIWLDASTLSLANDAEIFSWENLGSLPDPPIIGGSARMHTNALKGKPVVAFYAGQGRIRQSNIGVDLNWTVIYIARMMDNSGARIVTSQYPPANVLVGWWNFNMDVSYVEGFLTPDARKAQDLNWQLYTGTGEGVPGDARAWLYNNGVFLSGGHQVTGGWKDSFAINGYAPTTTEETGNFEVAEVVFYDRRLSDTERNQVEGYLYDKWLAVAPEFFGTVTMTAPSVLSTTAVRTAPATVTMSASSTLSTAAGRATGATVTMSAPSTLTTATVRTTPATVTMTAASTTTVAAVRTTPAAVVMTSPSVLTSTITPGAGGYAAMTAPSVLTAVTSRETFSFVNMTAPATLSTAGTRTTQATVNMVAAAVLSVAALRITQGAVAMAASSVLTPAAIRTRYAAVTMQAMSNLLVNAVKFTPTNSPFWLWNGSLEVPLNAAYWNGTSSENFTDYEIV